MRKVQDNSPQSHEYEVELPNPFAKSKNIQIAEDPERSLAVVRIYGGIEEPEEYIDELAKLDYLSNKYDVVEITLNSPGGSLNTTVDLASIINKFQYVVTIGKGEIASAAFMLWTMGDVRVVTDYSMYMAHRESYGMYGKTSEHKDAANTFGEVYEELFEECFGELLNDTEKGIAERSEAWVSYKDLLDRPGVISLEDYMNPANPYNVAEMYAIGDGRMFMYDLETNAYRSVSLQFGDDVIGDMSDYLYGITDVAQLEKPKKKKTKKKSSKKAEKSEKSEKNVKSKKKDKKES